MGNLMTTLKNMVLDEFTAISVPRLVAAVVVACILGLVIALIYRLTFSGVLLSRSFLLGLVLLSMITSVIILAISANLVLSLGMVGALSIVRFRTAVKDPMDTIFMFWALGTGILAGAGFLIIAAIATVLIGALFLILNACGKLVRSSGAYLMVIRYRSDCRDLVMRALRSLPEYKLKSQSTQGGYAELVLDLKLNRNELKQTEALRTVEGVEQVNLVACNSNILL